MKYNFINISETKTEWQDIQEKVVQNDDITMMRYNNNIYQDH